MRRIRVHYEETGTSKRMFQDIKFTDEAASIIDKECKSFKGGMIEIDTNLYYLLSAMSMLSKIEGFEGTPDFDIETSEPIDEPELEDDVIVTFTA